jgi:hypothetical protein
MTNDRTQDASQKKETSTMLSNLRFGAPLAALICVLTGEALAQTPLSPVATFRQDPSNAKVAEVCSFPSVFARVDLQSQGEVDTITPVAGKTYIAEFTFTSALLATVTDKTGLSPPYTGVGAPNQFQDTPGFEAILVKVNNVYSLFCTINAAIATVNAVPDGNRSTIGTVSVYWAPPLCPSTAAGLSSFIGTITGVPAQAGIIFQQLGGNQLQLGCGFPPNRFLRCDERPLNELTNNQFNLECVEPGAVFAGAPAANNVNVEVDIPSGAGGVGVALTRVQASQYCTTTSGGSSTKYTSCMKLYGY